MQANEWILIAGLATALGSLVYTWLKYVAAKTAETLVVRMGDLSVKLDSNKLIDAEKILEIAARQRGSVEVSIDGIPIYSYRSAQLTDDSIPEQIKRDAQAESNSSIGGESGVLMWEESPGEWAKRTEAEAAEKRRESEGGSS